MLLRRYHKVEEVKEAVEVEELKNEEIPFEIPQLKHPLTPGEPTVEEVSLEELIEAMEDDLSLEELTVKALTEIALEKEIEVPKKIKKAELIQLIREG